MISRHMFLQEDCSNGSETAVKGDKAMKLEWRRLENELYFHHDGSGSHIFWECVQGRCASTEDAFWLDSSSTEAGRARFSVMGCRGGPMWAKYTYFLSPTKELHIHRASGKFFPLLSWPMRENRG